MANLNPSDKHKGRILKEVRQAKGISLDSMHEITKIPLDILKSIEEGYSVRTVSSYYLKAFIKKYALQLGVDVKDVLDDYHEEKLPPRAAPVARKEEAAFDLEKLIPRFRQQQIVVGVGIILLLFSITRILGCWGRPKSPSKPKAAKAASVSQAKKNTEEKSKAALPRKEIPADTGQHASTATAKVEATLPSLPVAPSASKASQGPSQKLGKKVNLTVRAKRNGWLQVKVDGNLVFQSAVKQGTVESWQANKIIELSGKNINDLDFEVNGRVLESLGRSDRSARRILITEDGLSVKN